MNTTIRQANVSDKEEVIAMNKAMAKASLLLHACIHQSIDHEPQQNLISNR